jgi:hypothetical protein
MDTRRFSIRMGGGIEGIAKAEGHGDLDRPLGHSGLRCFTDKEGHFWLEQNAAKSSKWGRLAREGHKVAWEFTGPGGAYTGRMLIDGDICTPSEATKKFLQR